MAELNRAPVNLPKASANNKADMRLVKELRISELRYRRALISSVNNQKAVHVAYRKKAGK